MSNNTRDELVAIAADIADKRAKQMQELKLAYEHLRDRLISKMKLLNIISTQEERKNFESTLKEVYPIAKELEDYEFICECLSFLEKNQNWEACNAIIAYLQWKLKDTKLSEEELALINKALAKTKLPGAKKLS